MYPEFYLVITILAQSIHSQRIPIKMAVSIPREIFTLGAVQFSTQPLAQLQGQLLAKKAAKEEALNKYFLADSFSLRRL